MTNTAIVEGNITDAAELKFFDSGNAVLNFTLAHNERRKNSQTGEWENGDTTFWRCALWGWKAERWAEVLTHKGIKLVITGRVKVREFERKDGSKGLSPEIVVDLIGQVPKFESQQSQSVGGGFAQSAGFGEPGGPGTQPAGDPWGGQPDTTPPF